MDVFSAINEKPLGAFPLQRIAFSYKVGNLHAGEREPELTQRGIFSKLEKNDAKLAARRTLRRFREEQFSATDSEQGNYLLDFSLQMRCLGANESALMR